MELREGAAKSLGWAWGKVVRTASEDPADQDLPLGFADVENQATETPDQKSAQNRGWFSHFCRDWSGERTKSFCSTVSRHCGDKISLGLTPAPTQGSCLGPGMGPGWGNPGA